MATVQVARLGRGNTDVGFGVVQPFFCFSTKKKQVLLKPQMSRMWYRSSHLTDGKGKKIRIVFRLSCHFPIFNICCNYLKDGKRKTLLMTVNVELNNKIKPGYYFQTYERPVSNYPDKQQHKLLYSNIYNEMMSFVLID